MLPQRQEVEAGLPELKVVSMLNGKYIILGADYPPVENPYAYGNCWFVSDFVNAATPDEEIALLAGTDLRTTAIIGDDFSWAILPQADGLRNDVEETSEDVIARSDSDVAICRPTIAITRYARTSSATHSAQTQTGLQYSAKSTIRRAGRHG